MTGAAVVTGGAKGIGRAIVRRLAAEGFPVAFCYRTSEREAQALLRELRGEGRPAIALRCDVADRAEVKALMDAAREQFGHIAALVNNAGIAQECLFDRITPADWQRMFDVNVTGCFNCIQETLPDMLHRKQGRIVSLSSVWGLVGGACESHYSASKAAVIGLSKALAKELAPSGITVNCIAPGAIATDMVTYLGEETLELVRQDIPLGRLGTPEDVAGCTAFLLSEDAAYLTGQVIAPTGGYYA